MKPIDPDRRPRRLSRCRIAPIGHLTRLPNPRPWPGSGDWGTCALARARLGLPRWTPIIVGLALLAIAFTLLGGCRRGNPTSASTPGPTQAPETATNTLEPTATRLPTSTPTQTPTPTVTPWPEDVNPLTGEVVDDPSALDRVPVAIKIANTGGARVIPQAGIEGADLIFEHYNEGWWSTRWTGVYLSEAPERVGSVRSGRIIDLEIPAMYKAVFACSGFSNGVLALFRNSDLYPDQVVSPSLPETYQPDPFYRDFSRAQAWYEDTLFTSPALVREWANARGVEGKQDLQPMVFSEEPGLDLEASGPAITITIPWNRLTAEWRYNEGRGQYLRWTDGVAHTDALTGEQLSAANVVVLYVSQWNTNIVEDPHSGARSIQWALWNQDNPYRQAILFRDGKRFDGIWNREERDDMIALADEAGNTLPFKVGSTFFEVVPQGERRIEIAVES
jgi:hypothetical protein